MRCQCDLVGVRVRVRVRVRVGVGVRVGVRVGARVRVSVLLVTSDLPARDTSRRRELGVITR